MEPSSKTSVGLAILIQLALWNVAGRVTCQAVDFNRQIRPILSENCFACHGPDAHQRKAGLRLDLRESAVAARDGVPAIDPDEAGESALLHRIFSSDPDEIMPPPESHKRLEEEDKALLQRWIEAGAPYEKHWALVPPQRSALPAAADPQWSRNAIDRFIREGLDAEDMAPSPSADRRTWLRRVSFDLTGLPPTPEESRDLARSAHVNARERAVDRLFASHRYGERMAVAWLDAARYGDSSVMHADGNRDMWLWRDWLIDAYNTNKPFDAFTVEQLAGDLLPNPTVDQRIASGFNRNHATSDEGGAIPEELRVEYVVDRVKTTANVWLALSMECGQCHDHKYDPISQREYYQFFAYFNRTTDPGMQTRNGNQAPIVRIFSESQERRLQAIRENLATLEKRRQSERPPRPEIEAWVARVSEGRRENPPELGGWNWLGPFVAESAEAALKKNFGPEKDARQMPKKEYAGQQWSMRPGWPDGVVHALEIPAEGAAYLGREIRAEREMEGTLWLGSDDGIKVWLDGKRVHENPVTRAAAVDQDSVSLSLKPGSHWLLIKIANAGGPAGFAFRWESAEYPESIRRLAERSPDARPPAVWQELSDFYTQTIWPKGLAWDARIAEAKREEEALRKAAPSSMIMEDQREKPRVTYILSRGQYDQPLEDQAVEPGVPEALPPLPQDAPNNRLGLARWLTRPDHPLTARVAVNRYWAMLLGQGIVRTVGDFGNQGAWPSHMDLLDWLAADFVDSGWDVKRALRQIVLSATYGQSSRVNPVVQHRDPENRLLARAPRFRLQGEFIRDQALAASGLLVERVGGPGVKPYQPPNIWNEVSLNGGLRYQRDDGAKLYRRSLYTYWKRSAPMPNMMIFDSPSREKCTLERPRTNTPLQALVTLNDPQFVEAARVLAQRLLREAATVEGRIDLGYQLVVGRAASPREVSLLTSWLQKEARAHFEDSDQALGILEVGESPRDTDLPAADLGAWTVLAQLLLNLDETLTRN